MSHKIAQLDGALESEDDLATAENSRGPKVAKGRATKTTAVKRKATTKQPRQVLRDQTNTKAGGHADGAGEWEDEGMEKPKAKRAKTTGTSREKTNARAEKETLHEPVDSAPTASRSDAIIKGAGKTKPVSSSEPLNVIPETQQDPEQLEDVEKSIEIEIDEASAPLRHEQPHPNIARARSGSAQPLRPRASARSTSAQLGYPRPRERSVSVSGTERERRGGDPETRRKLQDVTRKYENLQLKYEALDEVAKSKAETNFEKLKRATDQKTKDADELVASLKKQIAELQKSSKSSTSETTSLQKQVQNLKTSGETQAGENTKLKAEVADLKQALQASQNETKSMEAKLVAARQQMANGIAESKAQGAEAKSVGRAAVATTTEAQKEARMKENLYSDLTGLIVRGVKRKEGEDEYDCIQTGRNGTLHFHLSIANDASIAHPKTPTGMSYEQAEFSYLPFLDESRDRDLLDLLPDFLTEEICFPRNQAVKFYTKVVENMTRKIAVEDD